MIFCNDCGVASGQPHIEGCDVARCLWTGRQAIQCVGTLVADCCRVLSGAGRDDLAAELSDYLDLDDPDHDCGTDVWTGEWPGDADARALGWFCYGPPWIPCGPDHPGARPDLNRLVIEGRWDRDAKRWTI